MKKHQSHKKRWIAFLLVVAMVLSITRPEMMKYIFAAEAGSEVVSEDGITNGEENEEPGTEADSEAEPVEGKSRRKRIPRRLKIPMHLCSRLRLWN